MRKKVAIYDKPYNLIEKNENNPKNRSKNIYAESNLQDLIM